MIKLIKIDGTIKYLIDILSVLVSEESMEVTVTLTDGSKETIKYNDINNFNKLADLVDHSFGNGPSIEIYESETNFESIQKEIESNRRKPGENPKV